MAARRSFGCTWHRTQTANAGFGKAGSSQAGRGGFPHEINLRRGQGVGLVDEVAERALQDQGFGGAGAGGFDGAGVGSASGGMKRVSSRSFPTPEAMNRESSCKADGGMGTTLHDSVSCLPSLGTTKCSSKKRTTSPRIPRRWRYQREAPAEIANARPPTIQRSRAGDPLDAEPRIWRKTRPFHASVPSERRSKRKDVESFFWLIKT